MESFSRILPMPRCRFMGTLRDSLLAASPFVFEENLNASYILRQAHEYTHNPTKAAIALTQDSRLVVMTSGVKKIDILLSDARFLDTLSITSDKHDRVIFKVQTGVLGTGTVGSLLEIRVRTKSAGKILELSETARGHAKADSLEMEAQDSIAVHYQHVELNDRYGGSNGTSVARPDQPVQRTLSRKPVPAAPLAT